MSRQKLEMKKVYDQLSKIAPTVSTDTVFKFKDTTKLMGKALGKKKLKIYLKVR